jgi:nicotinate-nucleotide adenylyltransferase
LKRAGIFGGTFNPIHFGHLRTALEVMEHFGLDQVLFVPTADPPHKDKKELADGRDRHAMLSLAIGDTRGFSLSDIELKRPGRTYTIDTVDQLQESSAGISYFLIVGRDAFMEIDTWKDFPRIFEAIPLIVMSRPGETEACLKGDVPFTGISDYLENKVSSGYSFSREKNAFFHPSLKPLYLFPVTPLGISATAIRRIVRSKGSIRFLVPDPVATYIQDKRLYV